MNLRICGNYSHLSERNIVGQEKQHVFMTFLTKYMVEKKIEPQSDLSLTMIKYAYAYMW